MIPTLVLPDRTVPGWDGDFDAPAPTFDVLDLASLLHEFDSPAHAAQYVVPGEAQVPRLNLPALGALEAAGGRVVAPIVLVDVDNPGHAEWTDATTAAAIATFEALPPHMGDGAGIWFTRRGYRLLWVLDEPLPVELLESFKTYLHAELRAHGVDADDATCGWNHLFRVPYTPDHRSPLVYLDAPLGGAKLSWRPVEPLTPGARKARGRASTIERPDLPAPGRRTNRAEIDALLGGTAYLESVRHKQPLAPSGQRNAETLKAIGLVLGRAELPDPRIPYRVLSASVEAMFAADPEGFPEGDPSNDWFWGRCVYVAELEEGRREQAAALEAAIDGNLKRRRAEAATALLGEATHVADDPFQDPATLERHLILAATASSAGYYILDQETLKYSDPVPANLLLRELRRRCPDLCPTTTTEAGGNLDDRELLSRYSTSVTDVVMVYGLEANTFDPVTGIIYERAGRLRADIEPEFNETIAEWLRMLGGPHHDKLLDWIAAVTIVDKPTCALYLQGHQGIGKGLLGEGLSRLFTGGYCAFDQITQNFNEKLARSPFVWADEKAETEKNGKSASAAVRRLIGSTEFSVRRLYRPQATLIGAPRLLITANNAAALGFTEALTRDDVGALVRRFGHIYAGSEVSDFLKDLGGHSTTDAWVAGDGLARHALWLRDNHAMVPGDRYLVEGWAPEFAEDLVTHNALQGQVVIALVQYLSTGRTNVPQITVQDGGLWVNSMALSDQWKALLGKDSRAPTQQALAAALESISVDSARIRSSGRQFRAWKISTEILIRTSERLNLSDRASILSALAKGADSATPAEPLH